MSDPRPRWAHAQGKQTVTITVTQEELFVILAGVELAQERLHLAPCEDSEFAYIGHVAEHLTLPTCVVTYKNMEV